MSQLSDFAAIPRTNSPDSHAPPLSALVSTATASELNSLDMYRRYTSTLTTETKLRGRTDLQVSNILYEVGGRFKGTTDWGKVMAPHPDAARKIAQVIPTNAVMKVELMDRHKKFSNFTGMFDYTDLSAIGRVLGKALAKFTLTGTLTCEEIRAGAPLNLRSISTRADPVSAGEGCVYIPRTAAIDASPGSFAALVSAANNAGAAVFTDMAEIDEHHRVTMVAPTGARLAMGCVYGIRILLSMYDDMDAGPIMAYAVTSGIHNMLSVVAHTDEGGLTRDALRAVDFTPPFGGIYTSEVRKYVGLPMPDVESKASFQSLVDSIAIGSAGLVALSDPLSEHDGKMYPTVFTATGSKMGVSGLTADGTIETQVDLAGQIAGEAHQFAVNFCDNLGKLFCVSGDNGIAANHLTLGFEFLSVESCRDLADRVDEPTNRHLSMVTAAPFFWVEPTSLFSGVFNDNPVYRAGYGHLAEVNAVVHRPMFEWSTVVSEGGMSMDLVHSWRSARTNALIVHMRMHQHDGLANLIPVQFAADNFHMVGGSTGVNTLRDDSKDAASYLWGRGQSPIPAPAEAMYLGKGIGSVAQLFAAGPDVLSCKVTRFPDREDLATRTVAFRCSRPTSIKDGKLLSYTREVARTRTRASKALQRAREALTGCSTAGGTRFAAGDFEPAILQHIAGPIAGSGAADELKMPALSQTPTVTRSPPVTRERMDGAERVRPAGPPTAGGIGGRTLPMVPTARAGSASELAAAYESVGGTRTAEPEPTVRMEPSDAEPAAPGAH